MREIKQRRIILFYFFREKKYQSATMARCLVGLFNVLENLAIKHRLTRVSDISCKRESNDVGERDTEREGGERGRERYLTKPMELCGFSIVGYYSVTVLCVRMKVFEENVGVIVLYVWLKAFQDNVHVNVIRLCLSD